MSLAVRVEPFHIGPVADATAVKGVRRITEIYSVTPIAAVDVVIVVERNSIHRERALFPRGFHSERIAFTERRMGARRTDNHSVVVRKRVGFEIVFSFIFLILGSARIFRKTSNFTLNSVVIS